eukprot:CAMPEP_0169082704 /NCGR_PEP_ID=MMETSP1015-20121227/11688_1 /TAXON_ID=342587 /ORGANISM="Karlodinium micrum, Strain CCMP2283" /LENGTH=45 /DNA_ID= /DNA_START= /DNA_END= /DNA_ORIENTATION=
MKRYAVMIVLVRVDADLEECVVATKTEPIGKFEAVIVLARCASSE